MTSLIGLNELGVVRYNELESQTQLTSLRKLKVSLLVIVTAGCSSDLREQLLVCMWL